MKKIWNNYTLFFLVCILIFSLFTFDQPSPAKADEAQIPAFPGAEGYGKYTTGGRGGDVYIVTNLNDSGPGSLRDAVSESDRFVVFEVSGNIKLDTPLRIRGNNITIAGQTAPGDGITVTNHSTYIEGNNTIIRYMRFRMGDMTESQADALSVRNRQDLIIDHSSMSWGIDEVASIYDMKNVTVQHSIVAEALHMTDHDKGRHGFGGIWGANTSYIKNIIAHNSSRNPRFKGTVRVDQEKGLDFRNNVIYNWNYYAGYGGNEADVNIVNNYYKYGPDTITKKRSEIVELPEGNSNWYVDGNYMYNNEEVTKNNWLGVKDDPTATKLTEPVNTPKVETMSATEAFEYVLENAGATLPRRDSIDARIVDSVREGTGRQINSIAEVGGWADFRPAEAKKDSNRDGIPDEWAIENGIDPMDDEWASQINEDGYTNLEAYTHSIVSDGTHNPEVKITSPTINEIFEASKSMSIDVQATVKDAEIERVVLYNQTEMIGERTSAPYTFTWDDLPDGTHYLFARAYSSTGRQTDSRVIPIHVNTTNSIEPWSSIDIGQVGIQGHSSIVDGKYLLKGDGDFAGAEESGHFMYQKVTGNFEITAQIVKDTKVTPNNREGVMIRETLENDSRFAMTGISVRGDDRVGVFYQRETIGEQVKETDPIVGPTTPYWVKMTKIGDTITGYISEDGKEWRLVSDTKFPDVDEMYVGVAVDAANEDNDVRNLNTVIFDHIELTKLPNLPLYPQQFYISRGADDLYLEWSDVELATKYDVMRSRIKGGPYETIATVTESNYVDQDVEINTNYFYVIQAANEEGKSPLVSVEKNGAILKSTILPLQLINENFERQEFGKILPQGFEARPNTETNFVEIVPTPGTSSGNDSEKVVKLIDNGSANTSLSYKFEPQYDKMIVELDYMQEEMSTFARAIRLMDGGKNNIEIFTGDGRGCETEYCWYFRNQGDAVIIPENNQFSLNEWYHVKIEVDIPAQEFTLYINDQLAGTLPFQGEASKIDVFESHTWGTSNQYLDNIEISTVSLDGPENIQAAGQDKEITITWDQVSDAESYTIYRQIDDARYELVVEGVTETAYIDQVTEAGIYKYTVAAFQQSTGEGMYGDASNEIIIESENIPAEIELTLDQAAVEVQAGQLVLVKGTNTTIQLPEDLPVGTTLRIESAEKVETDKLIQTGELFNFIFEYPQGEEDFTGEFVLSLGIDKEGKEANIYTYNEKQEEWILLGGEKQGNQLVLTVPHFSLYGVFSEKENLNPDPNPNPDPDPDPDPDPKPNPDPDPDPDPDPKPNPNPDPDPEPKPDPDPEPKPDPDPEKPNGNGNNQMDKTPKPGQDQNGDKDGQVLPNTATHQYTLLLVGVMILTLASILFYIRKKQAK